MKRESTWHARLLGTMEGTPDTCTSILAELARLFGPRSVAPRAPDRAEGDLAFVLEHEVSSWSELVVDVISAAQEFASASDAKLQLVGHVQEEVLLNLRPTEGGVLQSLGIDLLTCGVFRT